MTDFSSEGFCLSCSTASTLTTCMCLCVFFFIMQGDDQQQGERDGRPGAQLRQLQPAAAEGGTGGAQQQHGGVPDRQVDASDV